MKAHFDSHARTYADEVEHSIAFVPCDHGFFTAAKARALVHLAAAHVGDVTSLRVLDVGCGTGEIDALLVDRFAVVKGVDVAGEAVAVARERNPGAQYQTYDGGTLPFGDDGFDLTFAICVLHHVDPDGRPALVREMARVTRRGGLVAVFEHNPLNLLTRLAVHRCAFDEGVELLRRSETRSLLTSCGLIERHSEYILVFPSARALLRRAERALRDLPLGAQYVVAATK